MLNGYDEQLTRTPQIIGHRGSRATHPENSISGFVYAMECGADGVELDVHLLPGGLLAVAHDPPKRAALTLDEVLALEAPENFWFDIEAKAGGESFPRVLAEAIRRARAPNRVIVRSFNHAFLRLFHAVEAGVPLAALIDYGSDFWPDIARDANALIISPHYTTVTAENVRIAHAEGIRVSAWTVNKAAHWGRLAAMGVDNIITDDPAAALSYFK